MEILHRTEPPPWIATAHAYTLAYVCRKTLLASVVESSGESSPHQMHSLSLTVSAETNIVFICHTNFTVTK